MDGVERVKDKKEESRRRQRRQRRDERGQKEDRNRGIEVEARRRKKGNKLFDCKSNFILITKKNILLDSQIEIQTFIYTENHVVQLFNTVLPHTTTRVCLCIGDSDIVMGFRYTAG